MKFPWRNFPELEGLNSVQKLEVWQFGFGAVSSTKTHLLAMALFCVPVMISTYFFDLVVPGWGGRLIGVLLGVVLGGLAYDKTMYVSMRPHFLKRIEQGFRS